jgi:glycine betaine/choline ABC-type transport system substrate-binding protein
LIAGALLTGCSNSPVITVGSKNFTEQVILGEIVAQHLEQRLGQKVDRRLNLGGTLLAHQALVNGEIDLYPEYTGTALTAILNLPPSSDPAVVLEKVRRAYRTRWQIEWLEPLGFNDTFAIVIRGEDARRNHIQTLSEAAGYAPGWRLGAGYEFSQRPDGFAGLLETYGLPLKESPVTMDLGLLYKALEQNQVNMVAANSTDGLLSVLDVRVLEDDRGYFPPYEAAVTVRAEALSAFPGLDEALRELSAKFSDDLMRKLNYQVDGEHRRESIVASEFLKQAGLSQSAVGAGGLQ